MRAAKTEPDSKIVEAFMGALQMGSYRKKASQIGSAGPTSCWNFYVMPIDKAVAKDLILMVESGKPSQKTKRLSKSSSHSSIAPRKPGMQLRYVLTCFGTKVVAVQIILIAHA